MTDPRVHVQESGTVCAGCFVQVEGGVRVWYVVPSCTVHGKDR